MVILSYINFDQKIFQRGMVVDGDVTLRLLFNFMFTIFFPSILCVILNYEFKIGKSPKTSVFLSIFESTFNSISILSRNSIFNPTSNLIGIIKLNSFTKKYNKFFFINFFINFYFFCICCYNSKFFKNRNQHNKFKFKV